MTPRNLTAPFPWFGAKRRWAGLIWDRFGDDLGVYVEPFAGSLAVLLHRPDPLPREVVCDTDGGICNFWRAIRSDPSIRSRIGPTTRPFTKTSRHDTDGSFSGWSTTLPSYPRIQTTTTPKAAGWWVWGISLWIGPGWCHTSECQGTTATYHPRAYCKGGTGVRCLSADKESSDGRPHMHNSSATGSGVSAQKQFGKRPHVKDHYGGSGVAAQKKFASGPGVSTKTRHDLIDWFERIATRLKGTIVLNRGWGVGLDADRAHADAHRTQAAGRILLDPPYLTEGRSKIYGSDVVGESNRVAKESYEWALGHGDRYRIAYCCHENVFRFLTAGRPRRTVSAGSRIRSGSLRDATW